MAEKTEAEQAVIDAAIKWVGNGDGVYNRTEWDLVRAVEALPDAHVTPLFG